MMSLMTIIGGGYHVMTGEKRNRRSFVCAAFVFFVGSFIRLLSHSNPKKKRENCSIFFQWKCEQQKNLNRKKNWTFGGKVVGFNIFSSCAFFSPDSLTCHLVTTRMTFFFFTKNETENELRIKIDQLGHQIKSNLIFQASTPSLGGGINPPTAFPGRIYDPAIRSVALTSCQPFGHFLPFTCLAGQFPPKMYTVLGLKQSNTEPMN